MAPPKGGEDYSSSAYTDVALASTDNDDSAKAKGFASPRRHTATAKKREQQSLLAAQGNKSGEHAATSVVSHSSRIQSMFGSGVQGKAVSACVLYSVCSVSMVLTNKSLASSYRDRTPIDLNISFRSHPCGILKTNEVGRLPRTDQRNHQTMGPSQSTLLCHAVHWHSLTAT